MAFLVDIVADVLGDESFEAVDACCRSDQGVALLDQLADALTKNPLNNPIEKRVGEFVPGWLLDDFDITNLYGNDPYFVYRAILYCHRIGLRNVLHHFVFPEDMPRGGGLAGFREVVHKVLLYGDLEREGLIFYLPSSPASSTELESVDKDSEELADYFRKYMEPRGHYVHVDDWTASTGMGAAARCIAQVELNFGIAGLEELIRWQARHAASIDLYVPELSIYQSTLAWLIERAGLNMDASIELIQPQSTHLSALLRLPTLNPEAYSRLSLRDLLNLRDDRLFVGWREALGRAAGAGNLSTAGGRDIAEARVGFQRIMLQECQRVVTGLDSIKEFRRMVGNPGSFGISTISTVSGIAAGAVAAGLFDGSAVASAIAAGMSTTAAAIPPALQQLRKLLKVPELRETASRAFDIFATDG